MNLLFGILALVGIAVAAVAAVTIVGVRMMRDAGRQGTSGSLGNAMLEMQSLIEPGKKKVVEEQRQAAEAEDQDESGDPPVK